MTNAATALRGPRRYETMSLFYNIAYQLGFTPWEKATESHGHLIAALLERQESGRQPPFGRALDLGCGSGFWTVELARRGWEAVGIDNVQRAVRRAHRRAVAAQVAVQIVCGSVTNLEAADIGSGFSLFLDLGCFHGLGQQERVSMGRSVTALAAPAAVLLELVWAPARRGPLPRGASEDELRASFSGWEIIANDPLDAAALPRPLRHADPRCYSLRRAS